jgi:pyruvate dehydrogenase E2 component (dihydrolipoamide acetyltransferase)
MEEGAVVEWTVDEDEEFAEGDVIAVVESEKTTNEVEARESGQILAQFVDIEESVEPGDPIAYVGEEGETIPDDLATEDEATADATMDEAESADGTAAETDDISAGSVASASIETADGQGDARVSPRARSYARKNDIEEARLASLSGSGPDGAVIEQDAIAAVEDRVFDSDPVSGRDIYETRGESGLRRTIAKRMSKSAEVPQVTLNRRVDIDAMLDLKNRLETDRGLELSVSDFILAAAVEALSSHPVLNGVYQDDVHKLAKNVNLGVAVDIKDGLVTPVIRGADQRTITELHEERQRLVSLVQSDEYTMEDLSDGTFTITNLGHFGVESFDPLLNPPEVGILGVGDIRSRYDPDADETVRELGLSLTFDHRAVDGADAARFLDTLADELAHPLRLVSFGRDQAPQQSNEPFLETGSGPDSDRTAAAESTGGMQATVRSRRFEWRADEPEEQGGKDTAPSPIEQFVGSLSSCLTLMVGHMADRRDVDIDAVNVTAQAHPPEGQIDRIDVDVDITSSSVPKNVERVVKMAERACFVNQAIDDDVERTIDVTIEAP